MYLKTHKYDKMKRACFILPFFGEEPTWINFFFKSVAFNVNYDWIIFSDISFRSKLPNNVRIIPITLDAFNKLLSNRFQLDTNICHPYKICDFKPAFGYIFSEWLKDYMYWGYCDLDIVLGDLDSFLAEPIAFGYDIISPDTSFFPGHFCLCKNQEPVTSLFSSAPNYKDVFKSSKCYCFDEFIVPGGIDLTEKKIKKNIIKKVRKNRFGYLLRQNKFFLKLHTYFSLYKKNIPAKLERSVDFNHIIDYYVRSGILQTFKKQIYDSDTQRYRLGHTNWIITWRNGKLVNNEGKEIMYFHFPLSKHNRSLHYNDHSTEKKDTFSISGNF